MIVGKPKWMSDDIYKMLKDAIYALDKASSAIDDALWELKEQDNETVEVPKSYDSDGEVETDDIGYYLEDAADEISTHSYKLFCLIGENDY